MARMKKGKISGSIANVIWYTSNGIDIMRSKPGRGRVKQTEATKKNSSNFGKAAKMVSKLFKGLAKELNFRMLPANRGKTIGEVSKWIPEEAKLTTSAFYSFPSLVELNDLIALEKAVKIHTEVFLAEDHTITISFGAFTPRSAVKAPRETDDIEIKAVLVILSPNNDMDQEVLAYPVSLEFIYNNEEVAAQNITFPVQPVAGNNFLISLVVSYKGYNIPGMDRERKWLPAGVLGIGRIV
jgi:hypothetical protein